MPAFVIVKGFPPRRRERLVKCLVCGESVPQHKAFKLPDKGYICGRCRDSCRDYSTANYTEKGQACKKPAFSFEFETCSVDSDLLVLYRYGFIPCYDASIGGREWKSPIYYSLRPLKPILPTLERLADDYVDEDCGTHIHVACRTKQLIRAVDWMTIFYPLTTYLRQNYASTVRFWGRYFNDYCTRYVEGNSRYEAFNLKTNYNTVEFRLPVFKTARQFETVIRFARDAVSMIDDHFIANCGPGATLEDLEWLGRRVLGVYKKYESHI